MSKDEKLEADEWDPFSEPLEDYQARKDVRVTTRYDAAQTTITSYVYGNGTNIFGVQVSPKDKGNTTTLGYKVGVEIQPKVEVKREHIQTTLTYEEIDYALTEHTKEEEKKFVENIRVTMSEFVDHKKMTIYMTIGSKYNNKELKYTIEGRLEDQTNAAVTLFYEALMDMEFGLEGKKIVMKFQ